MSYCVFAEGVFTLTFGVFGHLVIYLVSRGLDSTDVACGMWHVCTRLLSV